LRKELSSLDQPVPLAPAWQSTDCTPVRVQKITNQCHWKNNLLQFSAVRIRNGLPAGWGKGAVCFCARIDVAPGSAGLPCDPRRTDM